MTGSATWSTGDWDADGLFSPSDLIAALADGGYEQPRRSQAVPVPEPSGLLRLLGGGIGLAACRLRRRIAAAVGGR